jgi:hypothetical protein
LVAVNLTAHVPVVNDSVGFCVVGPEAKLLQLLPASLLFSHSHEVGVLVDESVNATDSGLVPLSGVPLKAATGAGGAVNIHPEFPDTSAECVPA